MLRLGVNIDHVATLRQARYRSAGHSANSEPDPVWAAVEVELAGAHGVTVHLREDRRHMQERDVRLIRQIVRTRLNLELADTPEIVAFAEEVGPHEVCFVPEKREEVTTEGGLNVRSAAKSLSKSVSRLGKSGICVSLFIDADADQIKAAADTGAEFVELHTGAYANAVSEKAVAAELKKLKAAVQLARDLKLRVNAGHGLNYQNTSAILTIPQLETLNTGHSIISRAVFVGLRQAVREMLELMNPPQRISS